jgi:hypothetical protein
MSCHEDTEVWEMYSYLYLNLGTKLGWVVNTAPWPLYPQEKAIVPTIQETGWTLWQSAENFAPTGVRTPKCPVRSEALHRLLYPGHHNVHPAVLKTLLLKYLLHFSKSSFLLDSYLIIMTT